MESKFANKLQGRIDSVNTQTSSDDDKVMLIDIEFPLE